MRITKSFCDFVCVGFNKSLMHFNFSFFLTNKLSSIYLRYIERKKENHIFIKKGYLFLFFCEIKSHKQTKKGPFSNLIVTFNEVFC